MRPGRCAAIIVCLVFTLASTFDAGAQTADELYSSGVKARQEQRFDEAVTLLKRALALRPDNADTLVQIGFSELGRNDLAAARHAFSKVLALAPNYADAKFGMAMIEFRSGKLDAAQALAEPLVREHPGNSDFGGLLASIRKGQRRWRLDLGSEISDLSGGRSAWTDSSASLSYRVTPDTTVGVRSRVASRYGQTDLQIEGRIDQAFSPLLSGYGLVAATPQAAFLARFSIGAGASWRALPRADAYGPVFLNLDARYDRFAGPDVATMMPWVQAYMFEERLGISTRWVHAQDDEGTRADGYVLRADFVVTPRLNVFGGYADAPEISDGTLVPTRSVFAGASYDISDTLTLHGSFAHEQRPTFDRDTFGFSLTARF